MRKRKGTPTHTEKLYVVTQGRLCWHGDRCGVVRVCFVLGGVYPETRSQKEHTNLDLAMKADINRRVEASEK